MKQLTNRMMNFGKLVASGTPPVDAYEQAYGCTRRVAGRNAARCMRLPAMRQFLDELLEKTRREVLTLREEVREFLVGIMRNAQEMTSDRLKAAKQLVELEQFTVQRVEVGVDKAFRAAIVAGAAQEAIVRE